MKYYLVIIFLLISIELSAQENRIVYLFFDSNNMETCEVEDGDGNIIRIKKYRKEIQKSDKHSEITFYICDECFKLDNREKIDTCRTDSISRIKFETVESINEEREETKDVHFFYNSIFKKIYIIERQNNKIVKYPVIWSTDLYYGIE